MQRWAFEGLEPCDGKLSRTVLRGKGGRKAPALPGSFSLFVNTPTYGIEISLKILKWRIIQTTLFFFIII